jgi:hypothetical protein
MSGPLDLEEANTFVAQHRRHHKRVVGHNFSLEAVLLGEAADVLQVARRHLQSNDADNPPTRRRASRACAKTTAR